MLELFIGKVIFAVLISEFKLRRFCFAESFLDGIKVFKIICKCQTLIIRAFVQRTIFAMFPKVKGVVAVGAPEFGFASKAAMQVKETVADFAFDLRSFYTVVEVEIL